MPFTSGSSRSASGRTGKSTQTTTARPRVAWSNTVQFLPYLLCLVPHTVFYRSGIVRAIAEKTNSCIYGVYDEDDL